jgi:tRNA threonylcarbamoyladenosine biosynthesis protein TsaE
MKSEYKNLKLEDLNSVAKDIVLYLENHSNTSEELSKSFVMYLLGEMGAGKTTFTKSLAKVLGITDHLQSPTFTLMREYVLENSEIILKNNFKNLIHIDAYRFENKDESKVLGIKNYMENNIIVIEWPELMHAPKADMIINIKKVDENTRNIIIENIN